MNKDTFEKIILNLQLAQKRSRELYKLGLDMMQYDENYEVVIDELFRAAFNEEQFEWINWYLYEREGLRGEINKAYKIVGKKKVQVCHTIDSLWETVCEAGQQKDFDNRVGG
jgi:hypothetical protein